MVLEALMKRRSVRQYTGDTVCEEKLKKVLSAGLVSESGKNTRPWEFIAVRDKETLKKMAGCRTGAANMLENAGAAVVVLGRKDLTDTLVEDCATAMANMHLTADDLGLGSCWVQGRLREARDGRSTEEYLRELLGFPENYQLEAVLALGIIKSRPRPHEESELEWSKVHMERF